MIPIYCFSSPAFSHLIFPLTATVNSDISLLSHSLTQASSKEELLKVAVRFKELNSLNNLSPSQTFRLNRFKELLLKEGNKFSVSPSLGLDVQTVSPLNNLSSSSRLSSRQIDLYPPSSSPSFSRVPQSGKKGDKQAFLLPVQYAALYVTLVMPNNSARCSLNAEQIYSAVERTSPFQIPPFETFNRVQIHWPYPSPGAFDHGYASFESEPMKNKKEQLPLETERRGHPAIVPLTVKPLGTIAYELKDARDQPVWPPPDGINRGSPNQFFSTDPFRITKYASSTYPSIVITKGYDLDAFPTSSPINRAKVSYAPSSVAITTRALPSPGNNSQAANFSDDTDTHSLSMPIVKANNNSSLANNDSDAQTPVASPLLATRYIELTANGGPATSANSAVDGNFLLILLISAATFSLGFLSVVAAYCPPKMKRNRAGSRSNCSVDTIDVEEGRNIPLSM